MSVASNAVQNALAIANDNSHGYDQGNRWGPDYDCSSLVITAYKKAGVPLTCTYTGNMLSDMLSHGFRIVTPSVNLVDGSGMQPGDVLLNVRSHTAMYIGERKIVHASINEFGKTLGGKTGDQTGNEICVRSYYNFPWDYVLRYVETTMSKPASQTGSVTAPQSANSDLSGEIQNGIYTVKSGDTMWGIAEKFYGSGTEYARIMRDNGLSKSAVWVGQKLKIGEQPAVSTHETTSGSTCTVSLPIVKYGDNGMRVRKIQALLAACGYSVVIDGDYGSATKNAVEYLQKAKGIQVTGDVNAKTYEALLS